MNRPKDTTNPSSSTLTGAEIIAAVNAMTPAEIVAVVNGLSGLQLELQGDLAVISIANWTRERLLEEARSWGEMHGEAIAHIAEIYAAVRAGEEVDWLEDPDMLWDGLGVDLDDKAIDDDLVEAAQETAREAAQEAGEKKVQELTPEQASE